MEIRKGNLNILITILLLFIAFIGLNSCDETLDPVKENDLFYYSIFGYLDSSEERQWIRVINLQEEIDTTGEGIDGIVRLENLQTGESSILKDSLFQYSDKFYAYNFWTEQDIDPTGSYRITAERSDGITRSVTVEIPETFEDPEYQPPISAGDPGRLIIKGVDNLADASIRFKVRFNVANITVNNTIQVISDTIATGPNSYYIPIYPDQISLAIRDLDSVDIIDCELYVARAGPDWVDFSSLDRNLIALPDGISNVDNGTGYVVGVTSKRIFYPNRSCTDQND
jgi:hypothetical protein